MFRLIDSRVIGIYSTEGEQIARYSYDAWGNQIVQYLNNEGKFVAIEKDFEYNNTSDINRFIAYKNPFRYRSYYYDFETNLYYLNSRYYDPELGRFINADALYYLDCESFNGLNLYAYCINNPIILSDEDGNSWWSWLWKGLVGLVIVVAISVAVAFTAGVAAVALGASLGTTLSVMSGAMVGGLVAGGMSLLGQAVTVGLDNLNFGTLAIDTFGGAVYGGITGGVSSIGTLGAKVVGGVAKVALSGLTSMLHGLNNGLNAAEMFTEVGKNMLMTFLLQSVIIGGGELGEFIHLGNGYSNSIFTKFIKSAINLFKNNTELRITIIKTFTGILDLIKGKYNK